jgi:hypothetical protein
MGSILLVLLALLVGVLVLLVLPILALVRVLKNPEVKTGSKALLVVLSVLFWPIPQFIYWIKSPRKPSERWLGLAGLSGIILLGVLTFFMVKSSAVEAARMLGEQATQVQSFADSSISAQDRERIAGQLRDLSQRAVAPDAAISDQMKSVYAAAAWGALIADGKLDAAEASAWFEAYDRLTQSR